MTEDELKAVQGRMWEEYVCPPIPKHDIWFPAHRVFSTLVLRCGEMKKDDQIWPD